MSYLPLSHSAAQVADIWVPMSVGATVVFADSNALKGTLIQTLKEVRPTFIIAVPRVFEKIMETMQDVGKSSPAMKKMIATWAKKTGLEENLKKLEAEMVESNISSTLSYTLAKKIVFDKVKSSLGLDRIRAIGIGAAPISRQCLEYFLSLDIHLHNCYGLSETCGPHIANRPGLNNIGTVGVPMYGMKAKLIDQDENGEGEIIMTSRNVMMGYLFNPEKTLEVIDNEGWIHSGDLGSEQNGWYKITGKQKMNTK